LAYFVQILSARWRERHNGEKWSDAVVVVGLTSTGVARIASGEIRRPKPETLRKLAELLGDDADERQEIFAEAERMVSEIK